MGPRRLIAVAVAAVAALAAAGCADRDDAGATTPESTRIVFVVDGDTVQADDDRKVRLVQIDAPERGECYADQATRALRALLPRGARVSLVRDAVLDDVDDYGRLLRYVLRDGRNVAVELVARGAAVPYFFRGERGRHAGRLLAAVRQARAARRGMWGACRGARLDPGRGALTGPA